MFAFVAGSTRATTTVCASTEGVLAWSAIPEHGHSTTSSESWPGSSTAPAKRRSPMYVKPCPSIRRNLLVEPDVDHESEILAETSSQPLMVEG